MRTGLGPLIRSLAIAAAMLSSVACTRFTRSWNESMSRTGLARDKLEGCWEGEWQSDSEDEPGRLMAVIGKTAPGMYEAKFRAKVAKVFNFNSVVPLEVKDTSAEVWSFAGEKDVGRIAGGVYRHEGTSDGRTYSSRYTSADHRGTFKMERVSPVANPDAFEGGFGSEFREDTDESDNKGDD